MPVKVTHVVRQYLPSIGGMEEVVRNIARHQIARGQHQTRIITLDRLFRNSQERLPRSEWIDEVEVLRLPYTGSSRYPVCPAVLRHLDRSDVLHVHGVDFFFDFLALTRGWHRRPMLLSTHGGFFHTDFASRAKQIYFNTISRLSARAYAHIVATSRNDGELFSRIARDDQVKVIENGVDVEKFSDQASRQLTPTLIYFGRWSENKGILQALDLLHTLRQSGNINWHLIIAGREYDYTEDALQQRVSNMGLSAHVTIKASPSNEELTGLIGQASYYLCLSRHEGFGIAAIEAMSAGLTPLLSDIPPFRRIAQQSGQGLLAGDPETFIRQLNQLHLKGTQAYTERRQRVQEFALRYAWPAVADQYLQLYARMAPGQPLEAAA